MFHRSRLALGYFFLHTLVLYALVLRKLHLTVKNIYYVVQQKSHVFDNGYNSEKGDPDMGGRRKGACTECSEFGSSESNSREQLGLGFCLWIEQILFHSFSNRRA